MVPMPRSFWLAIAHTYERGVLRRLKAPGAKSGVQASLQGFRLPCHPGQFGCKGTIGSSVGPAYGRQC
jgi:hypothetical protein